MGLIQAALGAGANVLGNQWKEFFYQDAIPTDTLMVAGKHMVTGRSSNTHGEENVISNGSKIVVADGQCMIIIQQGKITEIAAEPGEYEFKTDLSPSIFGGNLKEGLVGSFKQALSNFSYGGMTGVVQKVYYINTRLIMDQKFGTPQPIYFRVLDSRINYDTDMALRVHGTYSFQITDPVLFYTNIAGNQASCYKLSSIEGQLKSEFVDALQDGLALVAEDGLRPSGLPAKKQQMVAAMNNVLKDRWVDTYGIEVRTITMAPPTMSKEDEDSLKELQKAAALANPLLAAGSMVNAQNQAIQTAAGNSAGAMTGFMAMGMAQNAGGMNANNLFAMGQQAGAGIPPVQQAAPAAPAPAAAPAAAPASEAPKMGAWTCTKCGTSNTTKFCQECGAPKPADTGWTCECGTLNKAKFCAECGKPKPAGEPTYKCDKCGWEPEDPKNPPKFCPECGDIFDDNDKV